MIETEVTVDTSSIISTKTSQQVSRNINELKRDMNTQITESMNPAIQETKLLSLQDLL